MSLSHLLNLSSHPRALDLRETLTFLIDSDVSSLRHGVITNCMFYHLQTVMHGISLAYNFFITHQISKS